MSTEKNSLLTKSARHPLFKTVYVLKELSKFIVTMAKFDSENKFTTKPFEFANMLLTTQKHSERLQIMGSHLHDHVRNAVNELPYYNKLSITEAEQAVTWGHLAENLD